MKYTINAGIFIDFNLSKVPAPDALDERVSPAM